MNGPDLPVIINWQKEVERLKLEQSIIAFIVGCEFFVCLFGLLTHKSLSSNCHAFHPGPVDQHTKLLNRSLVVKYLRMSILTLSVWEG